MQELIKNWFKNFDFTARCWFKNWFKDVDEQEYMQDVDEQTLFWEYFDFTSLRLKIWNWTPKFYILI